MSGECDNCGEHIMDCLCINIWAQIFFLDGSVSEGKRIPAEWLEPENAGKITEMAEEMLKDLNRQSGYLLLWGAGNLRFHRIYVSITKTSIYSISSLEE